jgi:hypothetical protein
MYIYTYIRVCIYIHIYTLYTHMYTTQPTIYILYIYIYIYPARTHTHTDLRRVILHLLLQYVLRQVPHPAARNRNSKKSDPIIVTNRGSPYVSNKALKPKP